MSDITVRALGEADWEEYRSVRLAALRESPEAFVASLEEEQAYDESAWRDRMNRSQRLLAVRQGEAVGVVSIGEGEGNTGEVGELFGLWVAPDYRGSGVATLLVKEAASRARTSGRRHLVYWVGTENGRAVAFASGMGFLPTDYRRPMGVVSADDGDEEIAMVLPLHEEPGPQPRL
ncbi:MAG TPA: GNAT family N-acetyltransferase [Intrasporangium sp.]|uniref:GNAT family N-acetyltransferase n=1 Tax=Intrasporangium sp. TaxID=1925024 RepID=UPI002D77C9EA|nr:GNAT family N-acetyltransferase [Intrasporangium sp.]HET7397250.1 GNAT family N-acetyltransferase [Intrasporangium sp.]